jgi:hypothetical protein
MVQVFKVDSAKKQVDFRLVAEKPAVTQRHSGSQRPRHETSREHHDQGGKPSRPARPSFRDVQRREPRAILPSRPGRGMKDVPEGDSSLQERNSGSLQSSPRRKQFGGQGGKPLSRGSSPVRNDPSRARDTRQNAQFRSGQGAGGEQRSIKPGYGVPDRQKRSTERRRSPQRQPLSSAERSTIQTNTSGGAVWRQRRTTAKPSNRRPSGAKRKPFPR